MSMLTSNIEYGHLELDWTCARPENRHKGYIQKLFAEMLNGVHESIYCSCLCLSDNDKANLHTLMSFLTFKKSIYKIEYFLSF